jgi:hypothetical protein
MSYNDQPTDRAGVYLRMDGPYLHAVVMEETHRPTRALVDEGEERLAYAKVLAQRHNVPIIMIMPDGSEEPLWTG